MNCLIPESEAIESAAREFEALSSNGGIKGCVACLDGYLLGIQVPAIRETRNVKAYFSGHYQSYGINIQAACDHKCRFVYVGVAALGGVNDISAFRKTKLSEIIQNLTTKWQILKRPLQVKLKHIGDIFLCITRLDNFCINE